MKSVQPSIAESGNRGQQTANVLSEPEIREAIDELRSVEAPTLSDRLRLVTLHAELTALAGAK